MNFVSLFESYLEELPNRNWGVACSGGVSRSGSHGWGDYEDVPAEDSTSVCTWDWWSWNLFPESMDEQELEEIYRERIFCLVCFKCSSCSYHFDSSDYYILVDRPREGMDWIPSFYNSYSKKNLHHLEEFPYPGKENILKIPSESFQSLESFPTPQSNYTRPKPGETSDDYWKRQITRATAPDWIRKKDGD